LELNKLELLRGGTIHINDWFELHQPTIEEIMNFGVSDFYSTAWTLCSSPWDMPSMLADLGIDFLKISEWEFFQILLSIIDSSHLQPFIGDVDFKEFKPMTEHFKDGNERIVLFRESDEVIFDEKDYDIFISYLREMIGFQHKNKSKPSKTAAKWIIEDDRKQRSRAAKKGDKENESMIYDIVLSLVNTEEFSYDYETVFQITLYQLMKSFTQIQGKKSAVALLQGSMSGFVDTKGISSLDMQWTYSDDKYKPRGKKLFNDKSK